MTEIPAPAKSVEGGPHLPWARQGTRQEERATSRVRKMAEGLPAWEPLPPGEILVRRPKHG